MDALVEIWDDKVNEFFTTEDVDPEFVLQLTTAADVFSWGLVLVKLQRNFLNHTVDRKGGILKTFIPRSTKLKNAGAPEVWVDVENLSGYCVPAAEAAWHAAVSNRISIPLHELMTHMAKLDPRDAMHINEALGEYTAILDAVRELYTPQKVYDGLKAVDEYPDLAPPAAGATAVRAPVAAAVATNSSSSLKAAPAKPPSPPKPTSTRRLKMNEGQGKALAKKKRAIQKAKEEAAEEVNEAVEELSELKKKYRKADDNLDQAKRDKMDKKVIDKFLNALGKYDELIRAKEAQIEVLREDGRRAVEAAQAAYAAFRAALPRNS